MWRKLFIGRDPATVFSLLQFERASQMLQLRPFSVLLNHLYITTTTTTGNRIVGLPLPIIQTVHIRRKSIWCGSRASTQEFKERVPRELREDKKEKFRQRHHDQSSSCSCCLYMLRAKNFPLTRYLLYDTDPAFKTPASSLSCLKWLQRTNPQLPLPVWLSGDQSLFNRVHGKNYRFELNAGSIFLNRGFSDMPTTIELVTDSSVCLSPSKRKLSSSSNSSPKKKIVKQESDAKMPSSVPSSPVKGCFGTPSTGSPLKSLNFQKEISTKAVSKLQFAKLSDKAHIPTKGSNFAAGFDLKSAYEYTVPKRGSCLVKTDIQIKVPKGTYGRVAPRSGLALKNKIDVGAGVIDQDYRGNVGVILFNHGDEDFQISAGDRVAQLICEKIEYPDIEEVQNLDATDRGDGGFGSTGVKS